MIQASLAGWCPCPGRVSFSGPMRIAISSHIAGSGARARSATACSVHMQRRPSRPRTAARPPHISMSSAWPGPLTRSSVMLGCIECRPSPAAADVVLHSPACETWTEPSSMRTGKCTVSSRLTSRRPRRHHLRARSRRPRRQTAAVRSGGGGAGFDRHLGPPMVLRERAPRAAQLRPMTRRQMLSLVAIAWWP